LELLQAERERGHFHSAWFKDAMLNRFYSICNCCKCCCGGLAAMVNRGVRMMASSGYVAEFDKALCADCGDCVAACPFLAISRNAECTVRDWNRCMGCGVCETACSTGAISLMRDERKGIPLDVRALA
jgi:heterodisulfide reductase subunit A-like polyferredoxin